MFAFNHTGGLDKAAQSLQGLQKKEEAKGSRNERAGGGFAPSRCRLRIEIPRLRQRSRYSIRFIGSAPPDGQGVWSRQQELVKLQPVTYQASPPYTVPTLAHLDCAFDIGSCLVVTCKRFRDRLHRIPSRHP